MLVRIATLADRFDVEVEPFWALRRLDGMIRARLREKEDKEEEGKRVWAGAKAARFLPDMIHTSLFLTFYSGPKSKPREAGRE